MLAWLRHPDQVEFTSELFDWYNECVVLNELLQQLNRLHRCLFKVTEEDSPEPEEVRVSTLALLDAQAKITKSPSSQTAVEAVVGS